MALPQVDLPLTEIEVPGFKKKVNFRPFVVKEEKILVMASESGDINDMMKATQQVITNCSFGKVDAENLPLFALQKVFLDLRSISISSNVDLNLKCGNCEKDYAHSLDLSKMEITYQEGHENPIKINDTLQLEMNYPNAQQLTALLDNDIMEEVYKAAALCIKKIITEDETIETKKIAEEEVIEWMENLPVDSFVKIKDFFATMPTLEHIIEFKCVECENENYMAMNGYLNFFV